MKHNTRQVCKNCFYYTIDEGDTLAYCCLEPFYTSVKPYHPACDSFASDDEEEDTYTPNSNVDNILYDGEDDDSLYKMTF